MRFERPGRLVVKVGTSTLTEGSMALSGRRVGAIATQISSLVDEGGKVVLVSSGAVASGLGALDFARRPSDIPSLQAAAAVGQRLLMDRYAAAFKRKGLTTAQLLLTRADMMNRRSYLNARHAVDKLLQLGVVPIVNENDTTAVEEIRYGDNDLLAVLVATLISADLLILLSDVEGLYGDDPDEGVIEQVNEFTPEVFRLAKGRSAGGSGGMRSKLEAAYMATSSGIPTVVASGADRTSLIRTVRGETVGTYFPARRRRMSARKLWIAWAPDVRGRVLIDPGAVSAVRSGGRSLLASGVTGVEGSFSAGEVVEVAGPDGVIGRGLVGFDSESLVKIAGRSGSKEVIHADVMVVL